MKEQHLQNFTFRPGPRLGKTSLSNAENLVSKGFGEVELIVKNVTFSTCRPAAIVGCHRSQRGRQDHPLQDDYRAPNNPDSRRDPGRRDGSAGPCRPDAGKNSTRKKPSGQQISGGHDHHKNGETGVWSTPGPTCPSFNFAGTGTSRRRSVSLSGGATEQGPAGPDAPEGFEPVILLDEPTNDLDVNTLRALEEGLENFGGCAVVISHDRWFLDRIATHILAFEGDSQVVFFNGNWSEYEADRKRRLGTDAGVPRRIKYRQLTR